MDDTEPNEEPIIQRTQISINTKKRETKKRIIIPELNIPPPKKLQPEESKCSFIDVTLIDRCNGLPKDDLVLQNDLNKSVANGPNYECTMCDMSLFSGLKLKMHYLLDHNILFCQMCDVLFVSEEEKTEHKLRIHSMVICEICQLEITDDINEHYKEEHEAIVCQYCNVLLHPLKHYTKHIIEKHCTKEKFLKSEYGPDEVVERTANCLFYCRLCEKSRYREIFGHFSYYHKLNVYYLAEIFAKHSIETKFTMYEPEFMKDSKPVAINKTAGGNMCKGCMLRPTKEIPLSLHRVYCSGGFPCPFCLRNFDFEENMKLHVSDLHVYCCELECENKEFDTEDELNEHYMSQHSVTSCKYCGDFVMNEMEHNLNIHNMKVQEAIDHLINIDNEDAICSLCNKNLSDKVDSLKDIYDHFSNDHNMSHKRIALLIGRKPKLKTGIEKSDTSSDDDSDDSDRKLDFRSDFNPKLVRCLFTLRKLEVIESKCCLCDKILPSQLNLIIHLFDKHKLKVTDEVLKGVTVDKNFRLANHLEKILAQDPSLVKCAKCFHVVRRDEMQQHIVEIHGSELELFDSDQFGVKCRFCHEVCWDEEKMREHELEVHFEEHRKQFLECGSCSNRFHNLKSLLAHKVQSKTGCEAFGDICYECIVCSRVFSNIDEVRSHFSFKHPKDVVVYCPQEECGKMFAVVKYAKTHFKNQHDKKLESQIYSCDVCGRNFNNKKSLLLHSKNSHAKGFKCVICNEKFQTSEHRKHHYTTVHPGELFYECAECLRTFLSKSGLHVHTKMHKDFSSICPYCNKEFFRRDSYKEHLLIHIGPKHQCPYCSKSFTQKSNLRRHIRLHTGEKPYNCPYCEKKFSDKGACNSHVTVHTREEECYCPICGKKFSKQQKLKYHMKRHTGEGLAKCDICQRGFTSQYDLRKHLVTHDQQTQIICQCGRGFSSEKYLRTHIKVVHNPNKTTSNTFKREKFNCFQCLVCKNIYSLRTTILKHLRVVHQISKRVYAKNMRRLEPEEEASFTQTVLEDSLVVPTLKVDLNDLNESSDDASLATLKQEMVFIKQEVPEELPSSSNDTTCADVPTQRVRKRKHQNPSKYLMVASDNDEDDVD